VPEFPESQCHNFRNLQRDVPLPADLARQLLVLENRETGHSTVISVEPNGSSLAALGTVATVNQVSFVKRFARRGTVMGRALMGQLAQEAHVEVELRGERDPATGFIHQFKFFVSLASWQRLKVRVGTSLAADLRDHAMPNGKHVWVAEEVYRMQPARGGGAA
jgi:hypothetical protein